MTFQSKINIHIYIVNLKENNMYTFKHNECFKFKYLTIFYL